MSKRYLSDFKRRCYEEAAAAEGRSEGFCAGGEGATTTEEQEMNEIQSQLADRDKGGDGGLRVI